MPKRSFVVGLSQFVEFFNRSAISISKISAISLVSLIFLSGCTHVGLDNPNVKGISLSGQVKGGNQPVTGSTIQLYAAGTTGDGSSATALISKTVTTDGSGSFSITGDYTCPSSTAEVYLVAKGGNPGLSVGSNNPNLVMFAALGQCSNLTSATNIYIGEVTTIGSLAALYPYATSYAAIGSGSGDLLQFEAAFSEVNEYTNISTGSTPGPTLPAGYYASSTTINTLGNIISGCINSTGGTSGDGTACGNLFSLAKPSGGAAPTDTVGAVIDILNNPTTNVAALYNLSPSAGAPYQPALTSAPSNWTLPIIPLPANPIFSPAAGTYLGTQFVTITETTYGTNIYYTTNGTTPTTASTLYTGPVTVAASETIKAFATEGSGINSNVVSAAYVITVPPPAATPTFSPGSGTYSSTQSVTITAATSGSSIYYTTDGSTPTTNSNLYTGPVTVYTSETLQAIAIANNYSASAVGSASYVITTYYPVITTVAGNGIAGYGGDNGPATSAELYYPYGTIVDGSGNLYIADFANNRVRKVTPAGVITTIAGTGIGGYSGDGGAATSAELYGPDSLAFDSAGNLYIDDDYNHRIRKVNPSGTISTVAGNGVNGYGGDGGPATSAEFGYSCAIAVDGSNDLYIADCSGNRIRLVNATGIISTYAGTGAASFSGDGGAATSASLNAPYGVALDSSGDLYICDSGNSRIRKVTAAGIISTFAGTGVAAYSGDGGAATSAALNHPEGLALDTAGNLYIADYNNQRVRKIAGGIISTVAGTGAAGYSGDGGPATSAALDLPANVGLDANGNVYISDLDNGRIRKIVYGATAPQVATPTFSVAAGTYNATQYVSIATTSAGASIFYTINGTTPSSSSTLYTGTITVSSSETIEAIAIENGYASSAVATAAYTITSLPTASTPTFSPAPGSYTSAQSVTISSTTGATIYYTTDGTVPTTSSTVYTGAITVSTSETINAIATLSGYAPSLVGSGGFFINQGIGIITTIAGTGTSGYTGDGGQGTSAEIYFPRGVAVDSNGNVYIADTDNNRVRKVTPAGIISTVAGNGNFGYSGDGGAATSASLYYPSAVAVDASGNLYIADSQNERIRKVTAAGIISTVAGTGSGGYSGDGGSATGAALYFPEGVAIDSSGNLYIADEYNSRIRKVTPAGIISTVAGNGTAGFSGDGSTATSAELSDPFGVAVDGGGNLYIADYGNNRIRKVTPGGTISTVAGSGSYGYSGDGGAATSAALDEPQAVAVDTAGNFYVADTYNGRIRKVNSSGIISTIAGTGSFTAYNGDGENATLATLDYPEGVAVDAIGNVYIGDSDNERVRKISYGNAFQAVAPTFSVPAGSYTAVQYLTMSSTTPGVSIYYTTDGSTPTTSSTLYTSPVVLSSSETVNAIAGAGGYANSTVTSAVYTITVLPNAATPTFSPAAGTFTSAQSVTLASATSGATFYYTTDGSIPTRASTLYTAAIPVTSTETINAIAVASGYNPSYVGSAGFYINPGAGTITTFAGDGSSGYAGDGSAATSASLDYPRATAIDSAGNLYIADYDNNRIRKVNPAGIISTIAGNGTPGFSGDGGLATGAALDYPQGVAVDSSGNVYIADTGNNRIRKISTAGVISTVAGNGTAGYSGDSGAATGAELNEPLSVALDTAGNFYIADTYNNRIRKVTPAGIITTVAGTGTAGYNGDSISATTANLYQPNAIALDTAGNLYIADYYNYRIRKVSSGVITTVAGSGTFGYGGDGLSATAATARMTYPTGVAVDSAGNIYFADSSNYRIRMVTPAGILSTAAGTGTYGFTGDAGPAASAEVSYTFGVSTDSKGSVYFSDTSNSRIRKITH